MKITQPGRHFLERDEAKDLFLDALPSGYIILEKRCTPHPSWCLQNSANSHPKNYFDFGVHHASIYTYIHTH